ncbi:MAG: hypothetical protein ABI333_01685 [bacterium]
MEPGTIIGIVVVLGLVLYYVFVVRKGGGGGSGYSGLGGDEAKQLRKQIKAADMSGISAKLKALREGAWDERDFLCDLLAPDANRQVMDAWVNGGQELALAHLLRGRANIAWAWQARGHGTSDTVTKDGANLFEDHLEAAEQDLLRAAELDPADPTPWAHLITVARGLGQGPDVARERFDEAVRRDPDHWSAHFQMLIMLTRKWGGSHESMFAFAQETAGRAAEGNDLGALVIMAHIERWLYFSMDDDKAGEKQYVKNAEARQECLAAYQRSLGTPQARVRSSTIKARNVAAFWFWLTREKAPLKAEIGHIGNAYTEVPWGYWSDPESAYSQAAQFAYR